LPPESPDRRAPGNRPLPELAKAEKVNDSYLSRILRLTLIAPDIIEAILTGRQPSTLQLDDLFKPMPAAWSLQHTSYRFRSSRREPTGSHSAIPSIFTTMISAQLEAFFAPVREQ
jgi:hypothetical protein